MSKRVPLAADTASVNVSIIVLKLFQQGALIRALLLLVCLLAGRNLFVFFKPLLHPRPNWAR